VIRKNLSTLKRVTNNFSLETETGKTLDSELYLAILDYKGGSKASTEDITYLKKQFKDLFESLSKTDTKPTVDRDEVEKIVRQSLTRAKIGMDNLDDELKKAIKETRVIRYEFPGKTNAAAKGGKLRPIAVKVIDDLRVGNNVMLIGGAGTGKTFLAKQIANDVWGKRPNTINCSQWTSPTEIIGGYTIEGYKQGKLIDAYSKGLLLILDELPKLDPNTAGLLNDALSNTRLTGKESLIEDAAGEKFERHPDFACIATGNVYPNSTDIAYAANNKQDLSLLDRFAGSVYFLNKDVEFEKQIIGIKFIWHVADKVRDVISENKWEAQMSLRWMVGARNVFMREHQRFHGKLKDGLTAHEGLTFAEYADHFILTFTPEQVRLLKEKINYDDVMAQYRDELKQEKLNQFN
jgi:cobaltochelatase CobS